MILKKWDYDKEDYIDHKINLCKCGTQPDLYSFYIKGTANRIHWCIKCPNCQKRTQHRRKMEKAIEEWQIREETK